jgi:hypothetical protein
MRRLALAIALACVISGMAHAGEIHTTGAVATPTPSPVTMAAEIHSTGAAAAGEVPSTGLAGEIPSTGGAITVLAIVLTLISSVR